MKFIREIRHMHAALSGEKFNQRDTETYITSRWRRRRL